MLELLWNMFEKSGKINAYLFYKALENVQDDYIDNNAYMNEEEAASGMTQLGG